MDEKLSKVVDRLTEQTRKGSVAWEDVSSLSLGDQFQATFGDVLVEVRKGDIQRENDEVGEHWVEYCQVQVRNHRGFVVATNRAEAGEHRYGRLLILFDVALASARNQEGVLDKLLQKLGA